MSILAQVMTLLGGSGLPDELPADPMIVLDEWLKDACRANATANPNAMVLATSTTDGRPSARVVLCKEIRPAEQAVVFFTNFQSRKGRELNDNPHAAVVFHFDAAGKQARAEGIVDRLNDAECDAYFASRHPLSRIGAWASNQSQPIGSRREFAQKVVDTIQRLKINPLMLLAANMGGAELMIPRPPHWGGFRLVAQRVELWTNSQGRLHDRAEWRRENDRWVFTRLQP